MNGVSPGCREKDENGEKPHKKNAEAGYLERKRHNRSDFWRRRKKVSDSPVEELGARLNAMSRKPDHPKRRANVETNQFSSGDGWSRSPLWTFLCLLRFETTEKWRPQPSTSQANATIHVSRK